jgi:hypothetical protein
MLARALLLDGSWLIERLVGSERRYLLPRLPRMMLMS